MKNRTQDANNSQLSTGNPNIQIVQPSRSEATPTVRHKPYEWIGGNIRRLPWNCHRMEAYSKTKEDSARKEGVNFLSGLWSLTRAKISLSSKHDFFGQHEFQFWDDRNPEDFRCAWVYLTVTVAFVYSSTHTQYKSLSLFPRTRL